MSKWRNHQSNCLSPLKLWVLSPHCDTHVRSLAVVSLFRFAKVVGIVKYQQSAEYGYLTKVVNNGAELQISK